MQMVSLRWFVLFCGATFASRPNLGQRTRVTAFAELSDLAARMRQGSAESFAALHDVEQWSHQMVQRIGNATAHLSTDEIVLIKKVIGILETNMFLSLIQSRDALQKELDDKVEDGQACNTDMTAEMTGSGTVAELLATANSYQTTHSTRKTLVQTNKNSRDFAETALTNKMSSVDTLSQAISPPLTQKCTSLPLLEIPRWDTYFDHNDFVDWFTQQRTDYRAKRQTHRLAEEALASARRLLIQAETQLRVEYCAFSLDLDGVCSIHDSCHGREALKFGEIKEDVVGKASQLSTFFVAGTKAIAHLKYLVAESTNTDVVGVIDTSQYQLTIPVFAAKHECTITQPAWEGFLGSACSNHASSFVDMGAGCCNDDSGLAQLFGGTVADFVACQQKCAEYASCGHIMYGWHGGQTTYCTVISAGASCSSLLTGSSDCGSGGGNGVHTYKQVQVPCHFQQNNDDIPDGIIVEGAGSPYWNGCYERDDETDIPGEKYNHQLNDNAEIYNLDGVWRIGAHTTYRAYEAPGNASDGVPTDSWARSLDSRAPTDMGLGPAPILRPVQTGGILHLVPGCNWCDIDWCSEQSTVHKTEIDNIEDSGWVLGAVGHSSSVPSSFKCSQLPHQPRAVKLVGGGTYAIERQGYDEWYTPNQMCGSSYVEVGAGICKGHDGDWTSSPSRGWGWGMHGGLGWRLCDSRSVESCMALCDQTSGCTMISNSGCCFLFKSGSCELETTHSSYRSCRKA